MKSDISIRDRLDSAGAGLRVGFPPFTAPFLRRNVLAITFGRRIWLHPRVLESAPEALDSLVRHELVHVEQYRRDGMLRFLVRYMLEYTVARLSGQGHHEAYRSISYEREAYGDACLGAGRDD